MATYEDVRLAIPKQSDDAQLQALLKAFGLPDTGKRHQLLQKLATHLFSIPDLAQAVPPAIEAAVAGWPGITSAPPAIEWECGRCQTKNPDTAASCTNTSCGIPRALSDEFAKLKAAAVAGNLAKLQPATPPSPPSYPLVGPWTCRTCGTVNTGGICSVCGETRGGRPGVLPSQPAAAPQPASQIAQVSSVQPPPGGWVCTNNHANVATSLFCPHCGEQRGVIQVECPVGPHILYRTETGGPLACPLHHLALPPVPVFREELPTAPAAAVLASQATTANLPATTVIGALPASTAAPAASLPTVPPGPTQTMGEQGRAMVGRFIKLVSTGE